jgi:hypothetical protein
MRELQCSVAAVAHLGSRIMGWSAEKDAAQRLAEQQHLLDRAAHIGQLLALVLLGITALRVGRLWEAHQVRAVVCGMGVADVEACRALPQPPATPPHCQLLVLTRLLCLRCHMLPTHAMSQVCQAKVYEVGRFSHLAQRLTGTSSVAAGWRYLHCCASQLGE